MSYVPGLLGLAFALCIGSTDFISRRPSAKIGYYNTWVYASLLSSVEMLAVFPFFMGRLDSFLPNLIPLIAISALQFAAGNLVYRSYLYGAYSIVAPILYAYPAVTVILSVVFLKEQLTGAQLLALGAVLIGVATLSTKTSSVRSNLAGKGKRSLLPGVSTAATATTFFGVSFFGLGAIVPSTGFFLPAVFSSVFSFFAGLALAPAFRINVRPSREKFTMPIALMSLLRSLGILSFNLGIQSAGSSLSIVTAISSLGAAFVVAYAIATVHERPEPIQAVGIVLSLLGVASLLYLTY